MRAVPGRADSFLYGRMFPVSFMRAVTAATLGAIVFSMLLLLERSPLFPPPRAPQSQVPAVLAAGESIRFTFNTDGILHEAARMEESSSPYWWLNSGGKMVIKNKVGATIHGSLPTLDWWRLLYSLSSAEDTDNGYHPQNLFRLVTKPMGRDVRVESLFKIEKDNWGTSPNQNASNGLLLMTRYADADNLYYSGIRVDGTAVIKKKYKGAYYTMAQKQIYAGIYDAAGNDNMLPHREWIGLRTETVTQADGSVKVSLFMKKDGENTWKLILEATDKKQYGDTPPITAAGHVGIRTDFMDVSFESFRMQAI